MFSPVCMIRYCGVKGHCHQQQHFALVQNTSKHVSVFLFAYLNFINCNRMMFTRSVQRRQRTTCSLFALNSVLQISDISEFHSLSGFNRTGDELSRDGVFKVLVHARTSLQAFLSLLLVDCLPASQSVFSSVIRQDWRWWRTLSGGLAGSVSGSNPHVNNFFANMKLIFAVFSSGYCGMCFRHFKYGVVLFEVAHIKSCVG